MASNILSLEFYILNPLKKNKKYKIINQGHGRTTNHLMIPSYL